MKYWCEGSKVITAIHDAFSILFPAWETLFCKVMESYLDDVDDPELKQDMLKFIKQEQSHANAHSKHNTLQGLDSFEEEQYRRTKVLSRRPRSKQLLAAMVSIEHMAATLGQDYLDRYSNETSREHRLFAWHSREEIEHKDVAFRLWKHLGYTTQELRRPALNNYVYVLRSVLSYVWSKVDPTYWVDYKDLLRLFWRLTGKFTIRYSTIFTRGFNP